MKTFVSVLLLICVLETFSLADYLKTNYLVVYDSNSNIFRQVSLVDSLKTFDIQKKSDGTDLYKIIIEQKDDHLKLFYLYGRLFLGILDIRNGISNETIIRLFDSIIFDYDKEPGKDVVYFASKGLFRRDLTKTYNEQMIPGNITLASTFYSHSEGLLYYDTCPTNGSLRRVKVVDKVVIEPIALNKCLEHLHIDLKTKEIYGTLGNYMYVAKLDSGKVEIIHVGEGESLTGFAVGSKYLFYSIEGQNVVYRIDRKSRKIDKFYEFPEGKIQAIGLLEDDLTYRHTSGSGHLNFNFFSLFLNFYFIIFETILHKIVKIV